MSTRYPPPLAAPPPPYGVPRPAAPPPNGRGPIGRRSLRNLFFLVLASGLLFSTGLVYGPVFGVLFGLAPTAVMLTREPGRNMVLFGYTCLSTYLVGGPVYAAGVMTILLTHEMGHYIAARRHGIEASLPYFVPIPVPPFGTMGAVIISRSPFPTRRELFDVGVAGPIAGFLVAVPLWIIGLRWSTVAPPVDPTTLDAMAAFHVYGDSLLTWVSARIIFPDIPDDHIIMAHPLALAGWTGLFVTALNLIPAGSLDGGHIAYALWWRTHHFVSRMTVVALIVVGLTVSPNWLVWAVLIGLFGLRHPPPLYPQVPLTRGRRWIAVAALGIFVLTFIPTPLRSEVHEPQPRHDSSSERRRPPGPDRDPGGGRTLDVRAGPEPRVPLRQRPA